MSFLKQKEIFRQSCRERERERERFTDLYHDCKHANKAMVSPEKMSCLFFMTSNTEIDRVYKRDRKSS